MVLVALDGHLRGCELSLDCDRIVVVEPLLLMAEPIAQGGRQAQFFGLVEFALGRGVNAPGAEGVAAAVGQDVPWGLRPRRP